MTTQQTASESRRRRSKEEYDHYINSTGWMRRKAAYYANHEKKCRACGATESIHLHHHTYKRMGAELDSDLVPLCQGCHETVHRLHGAKSGSLTSATHLFLSQYGAGLDTRRKNRPKGKKPDFTEREVKRERRYRPSPRPDTVIRGRIRLVNRPELMARPELNHSRELLIPLREVVQEFAVGKGVLVRQGFRRAVPQSTVQGWRTERPVWMPVSGAD